MIFVQKNSEICTYSYPDTILSVKLNRQVSVGGTEKDSQPAALDCYLSMATRVTDIQGIMEEVIE